MVRSSDDIHQVQKSGEYDNGQSFYGENPNDRIAIALENMVRLLSEHNRIFIEIYCLNSKVRDKNPNS